MAEPNRVHRTDINKKNFNFLLFAILIGAIIGSVFLAWNHVDAGIIYTLMFLVTIGSIWMVHLVLADDSKLKPITDYVKIPIATKLTNAVFFNLMGFGLPIIVNIILKITKSSYNVSNLAVPLFGANINTAFQSFSTAEIGNSMAWKLFTIMFTAGAIETFVYKFGTVIVGILIGFLVLQLLNRNETKISNKKPFLLIFAFGFSILTFILSHLMNGNYGPTEFIVAGIFLLVAIISIYLAGAFLLFWVGYHMSNNLLWLIQAEGMKAVAQGFISWFGLLFVGFMLLQIYYFISNWPQIWKDFLDWVGW